MIVQVKKDNNNEDNFKRFEDEGVVFKAKLIGSELVLEPKGDKMCQNSFQRLKAIIKGTNSHKKRVVLKISYDGVKVYDEKTNEILHHHEVSQISFIASDDTDNRTFGYVGDVPNKAHQFVCFKSSGPAINVISVINSLFEAVVEKKKQAEREKQEEKAKKIISDDDIFGPAIETTIFNFQPCSILEPANSSSNLSILEPANSSTSIGPFRQPSSSSSIMNTSLPRPNSSATISSMARPNSSATIRQIPSFHVAAAHNNFSKSFNTTYLKQTSSASSGFVSVDQDISSTSAGARSTPTLEANMFRRTNPFDDDFFA